MLTIFRGTKQRKPKLSTSLEYLGGHLLKQVLNKLMKWKAFFVTHPFCGFGFTGRTDVLTSLVATHEVVKRHLHLLECLQVPWQGLEKVLLSLLLSDLDRVYKKAETPPADLQ